MVSAVVKLTENWKSDAVSIGYPGQPIQANTLGNGSMRGLIKAAKVRLIKFHGLRHTCATLLLQSGYPVQAAFISLDQVPIMYRGRNSDGRLPFVTQLDGYVQQQIAFGERARITVSLNAINVLNQKTAINYFPTELFPGQAIAVDKSAFYQGVDTQARSANSVSCATRAF